MGMRGLRLDRRSVFRLGPVNEVAVGTTIADRPPHRSARALISACGSYRGLVTAKHIACPHTHHLRDTRSPAQCRERVRWKVFSLISSLPSSLSADVLSVFVRMIHQYYAAVRLLADVHAGRVA